jgi:hypothetical protein
MNAEIYQRLLGINLQGGDSAFWTSAAASSCEQQASARTPVASLLRGDGEDGDGYVYGSFVFDAYVETLQLCYRFNNQDAATKHILSDATEFLLFPDVRVATLGKMSATPRGTGVGCVSTTIA